MLLSTLAKIIGGYRIVCLSLFFSQYLAAGYASTGIRALDTPAIALKDPSKVVLIAIANAGSRLVAVGEHGVIIYSDDNGITWRQSTVPADVTLTAVAFANASDGWAVGHYGVILHTSDGAASWQMQLDGIQANQLTLATAKSAVADHDQSPGAPLALRRAGIFMTDGPDKPFLSLLVSSSRDVIAFGAYRMAMQTTDGGQTWVDWDLRIGDPLSHNLYDVAGLSSGIYLVGEAGSIFRSTDSGRNFPAIKAPSDATLLSVLPTGDEGIFVCGVAGEAFRSMDSGKTWKSVNLDAQSNLTDGLALKSGTIIVASEDGNIYVSFDHARTFSLLPIVQPMALYGLAEAQNGDVAVVGSGGVIMIPANEFAQRHTGE
jgi:photosystem II stability/assembly factor-like uncharacterized protein